MTTPAGCPVLQDTRTIQGLSHDLERAIRKLRRDLQLCEACPSYDDCTVLKEFNAMVHEVISEVSDEWNQTALPQK